MIVKFEYTRVAEGIIQDRDKFETYIKRIIRGLKNPNGRWLVLVWAVKKKGLKIEIIPRK